MPGRNLWVLPTGGVSAVRKAFASAGAKVLLSLGEADREIAHYAEKNGCFGVLGACAVYSSWAGRR